MGRRKGPGLTRADVVAAAVRCVLAEGPGATGVSRVARELGIKPPSLYNHVGKGELEFLVSVEGSRMLLEALKAAVREVFDPKEQLFALALGMRAWVLEHPGLYELMARVPPQNEHPAFAPILRDMLDLFAQPLGQLGVGAEDRIHAIRALRASVHGFVLLETSGQFALAEAPDDSFRRLIAAVLRGLTP